MPGTALFPISLSNQRFSTENVLKYLQTLPERYDKVCFLVANSLQHYNKAMLFCKGTSLSDVLTKFDGSIYLKERCRWTERLERMFQDDHMPEISVWDLSMFDDEVKSEIFRRVLIAYALCEPFRSDVEQLVEVFANRFGMEYSMTVKSRLSLCYILEEIAYSIRLHVIEGIRDEYYIGLHSQVTPKLYNGQYGLSPWELAGIPHKHFDFRIFHPVDGDRFAWQPYSTDSENYFLENNAKTYSAH